ncbi:hypothetical protein ACOBV9_22875 (plasmid) [Pseudoalteromonas espejiana]
MASLPMVKTVVCNRPSAPTTWPNKLLSSLLASLNEVISAPYVSGC